MAPAVTVPLLVTPSVLLLPNWARPAIKMPTAPVDEIVLLFVMPPVKVETSLLRLMPSLAAEIVLLLLISAGKIRAVLDVDARAARRNIGEIADAGCKGRETIDDNVVEGGRDRATSVGDAAAKVETPASTMPLRPAEIVPLLVMPPPALELPNWLTLLT